MVTLVEDVTDGAVNIPLLVIEPALAFHTTAVFAVDVNVATNSCFPPEEIVTTEGETAILMLEELGVDVLGAEDGAMPLQPVEMHARAERNKAIPKCLEKPDTAFWPWPGDVTKNIWGFLKLNSWKSHSAIA